MNIPPKYDSAEKLLSYTKQEGSCRVWQRGRAGIGYGHISQWENKKTVNCSAHRAMWFLLNGEIPDGMYVCHACDNPPCINPDHLFLGTSSDNANDRKNKGRGKKGSKHGMSKLDEQEVIWIRKILSTKKLTHKKIGVIFRVSRTCISAINRGETWNHAVSI